MAFISHVKRTLSREDVSPAVVYLCALNIVRRPSCIGLSNAVGKRSAKIHGIETCSYHRYSPGNYFGRDPVGDFHPEAEDGR